MHRAFVRASCVSVYVPAKLKLHYTTGSVSSGRVFKRFTAIVPCTVPTLFACDVWYCTAEGIELLFLFLFFQFLLSAAAWTSPVLCLYTGIITFLGAINQSAAFHSLEGRSRQ